MVVYDRLVSVVTFFMKGQYMIRDKKDGLHKIISVAMCVISFICFVSGCGLIPTEEEYDAIPVVHDESDMDGEAYVVKREDLKLTKDVNVKFIGTKRAEVGIDSDSMDVTALPIDKILIKKGDRVKKGQSVVRCITTTYDNEKRDISAEIETLKMQIRKAESMRAAELKKCKKLHQGNEQKKMIIEQYLDEIRGYKAAIALRKMDIKEMDEESGAIHTLRSPISGVVTYADHSYDGQVAGDKAVLVRIRGKKYGYFIPEDKKAAKYLKSGKKYDIYASGGSYEVKAVKKAGEYILKPTEPIALDGGVTGTFTVTIEEYDNVLVVPEKLVYKLEGKDVVYIEDDNGIRQTTSVETGARINASVEIKSGVKEGDKLR